MTYKNSIVNRRFFLFVFVSVAFAVRVSAATAGTDDLERREWNIDGMVREAMIHVPTTAAAQSAPIVFVFHGHGGDMNNAARMFGMHTRWPEAIVVYMQGLNTPGRLADPDGKVPGWQRNVGDQSDR